MKNKAGPPVRGADFLERPTDTQELWHKATRGHVLMLAPRRVGKTSLLRCLEDTPQDGWRCVFISAESLATESHFVARLFSKVAEAHPSGAWVDRLGANAKRFFQGVGKATAGPFEFNLAESLRDEWRDLGAAALKVMQELEENTLILIDEFPLFVRNLLGRPGDAEGKSRAQHFLDWFREIRNAQEGECLIHFLLTGSIGLDGVVKSAGLSGTVNDLDSFSLGPLSPNLASELLRRLSDGEGIALTPAAEERVLEKVDWLIPYHLQLLFREILGQVRFHGRALDAALVDEAYDSLLSPKNTVHFSHWVERLDKDSFLSPQEKDLRKALLKAAARDPGGVGPGSIQQISRKIAPHVDATETLINLGHDGYLTSQDGRWRFTSSLLREWWCRWKVKAP